MTSSWQRLIKGESGLERTAFDPRCPCQVAGTIKDFDLGRLDFKKDTLNKARRMGKYAHYAFGAVKEALEMSGLDLSGSNERMMVLIGTGIGGADVIVDNIRNYVLRGVRAISPYHIIGHINNMASGFIAIEYGIRGPSFSVQSACASTNYSIAMAMMMIRTGVVDTAICGGAEDTVNEFAISSFCRMRALATRYNDSPKEASRPFDKDRDGFIVGAGSGILILEDYDYAKKRGANILCEVLTVGLNSDIYDLVSPDPSGINIRRCMELSLSQAAIGVDEVDYINAHGTSTYVGDLAESRAIDDLFHPGSSGSKAGLNVSSTKSMIGHALGAASGLEAVFSVMSIRDNLVPPTINLEQIDEEIPLSTEVLNSEALEKPVDIVFIELLWIWRT